ncbi:MAG: NADH-quinone oxidoreductase subunit F, partial [Caldisericia bacterium]|nr:NADH-quinone oxidoreductase subunit F [Caldisericia bacterium]
MKIMVGQASCGIAAGAAKISDAIRQELDLRNSSIELDLTGCCGTCYLEPIVDVYGKNGEKTTFVNVKHDHVKEIVDFAISGRAIEKAETISEKDLKAKTLQKKVALRNTGEINPEKIDEYIERKGYDAIKKCLQKMSQEEVIAEVKNSGLRGRGGAGFPTWFKWNAANKQNNKPKYMVCNGDEGDPGAFMDRSLLEGDPHSVIEGMMIGGYAIGASEGIFYVRAEYPLAIKRLEIAIEQARGKGILGKNIFGSGFDFDIWIKAGAGAFVCGEE